MVRKTAAKRPIGGKGTRMFAFLLALGAAITAAGLALVASGVSFQDHAFDVSNATPGVVAIIGGCILVGLAFVVRALLRVERALLGKPMPRAVSPVDMPAAGSVERAGEPRIPLPTQLKTAAIDATVSPATAEQPAAQVSLEKSTTTDRIDSAPVVDAGDVLLLPNAPVRPDDENNVAQPGVTKLNGSAHATPTARLPGGPTPRPQPKSSIFDTLWPKAPRSPGEAQPAAVQPAPVAEAPVARTVEPAPGVALHAAPAQTSAGVSILKSGVVEGMAYTLYSDGSIEAQLPGGTLRFRSITELRSHIEQNG
jgi:hypothetical protein